MADIDSFLTEVLDKKGSDLHFIAGDPPRVRQYGDRFEEFRRLKDKFDPDRILTPGPGIFRQ